MGVDISLSSPGFAVIDVKSGIPHLVAHGNIKTDAKQPDGWRFSLVESYTAIFAAEHAASSGYDAIIREDYKRPASKRQGQTIYGAWAAVDCGLHRMGYVVTDEVNAAEVKLAVGGHGKADKVAVASGVRKILRLGEDYTFGSDDESDACAIILTWLIKRGEVDAK